MKNSLIGFGLSLVGLYLVFNGYPLTSIPVSIVSIYFSLHGMGAKK